MTNPTSNFGWQMPTSTDLVTDLPADFEVFGQAVDTSLADLKGGTTGQVLSKASNTNMDFTWVTTDDANAIQNSIVDAKGDLVAATANDTPARLAVGTNGQLLVANSAAATGLEWQSIGTYTAFAPVVTQSATVTSTCTNGSYTVIGNFVHWYGRINITAAGTANNEISISIPVEWTGGQNPEFSGTAQFYDASANVYYFCDAVFSNNVYKVIFLPTSSTGIIPLGATGNTAFAGAVANGDVLNFSIVYRKA
jgi:hypothetical protein